MAVPGFGDIGKNARDLFDEKKGPFQSKAHEFEAKYTSVDNVKFATKGSINQADGKFAGHLESKYDLTKLLGAEFTTKWNVQNVLDARLAFKGGRLGNFTFTPSWNFQPLIGRHVIGVDAGFKNDRLNATVSTGYNFESKPIIDASDVFKCNVHGFTLLTGGQASFSTVENKLTKYQLALQLESGDFKVSTSLVNGSEFVSYLYQNINANLQMGSLIKWNVKDSETEFGIASKYRLDNSNTLHTKIHSNSHVGIALTHKLNPLLSVTAASSFDVKNLLFSKGQHQFGVSVLYDGKA